MPVLRFTAAARADVLDAYDWYETKRRGLGIRFLEEIDAAVERIKIHPRASSAMLDDIRRVLLRKFPYGLFFRIEPEAIYVIACFHASRDPKIWQSRA